MEFISPLRACAACGFSDGRLYKCSECRSAVYCSRKCQLSNWNDHKECCLQKRQGKNIKLLKEIEELKQQCLQSNQNETLFKEELERERQKSKQNETLHKEELGREKRKLDESRKNLEAEKAESEEKMNVLKVMYEEQNKELSSLLGESMQKIEAVQAEYAAKMNILKAKLDAQNQEMCAVTETLKNKEKEHTEVLRHFEKKLLEGSKKEAELQASLAEATSKILDPDILHGLPQLMNEVSLRSFNEKKLLALEKLFEEYIAGIRSAKEELRNKESCCICMDEAKYVVFMPCRHLATCTNCSHPVHKCPLCQVKINQKIHNSCNQITDFDFH